MQCLRSKRTIRRSRHAGLKRDAGPDKGCRINQRETCFSRRPCRFRPLGGRSYSRLREQLSSDPR